MARRIFLQWATWGCLSLVLACEGGKQASKTATTSGDFGSSVRLSASSVTAGYALGRGRQNIELESFGIGKHPITVAQYRACIEAGSCTEPSIEPLADRVRLMDRPTSAVEGGDDLPVNCVSAQQAAAYCAWVGGRLPTASEWLRAARGSEVVPFAWGSQEPTCDKHPVARGLMASERSCCRDDESCNVSSLMKVGKHPAGASPDGLQDVLLADSEYVTGDRRSSLTHCGSENCAISGKQGQIEAITSAETASCAVTFRCARSDQE